MLRQEFILVLEKLRVCKCKQFVLISVWNEYKTGMVGFEKNYLCLGSFVREIKIT